MKPLDPQQVVAVFQDNAHAAYFARCGSDVGNSERTDEPFEAPSDVFFGDYTGIVAFGGHVYGVGTEKPNHVPEAETKAEDKHSGIHGTVIKVGVSDFKSSTERQASIRLESP